MFSLLVAMSGDNVAELQANGDTRSLCGAASDADGTISAVLSVFRLLAFITQQHRA